ncbi:MAG: DUF695 domain-containing protein [Muribaculaceae bacterium]
MAKLKISDEWWSAPAEAEGGELVIVTGRRDMDEVIACGKYRYRVEVSWHYGSTGMPDLATSQLMEQVTDALKSTFKRDPVAILTGIYTGAGERNWVFYTMSLHIFSRKFNEALEQFEQMPLEFYADEDPDWEEYKEMRQTEISDDD